jgi:DNA-binding transcriptional LysR family regulator
VLLKTMALEGRGITWLPRQLMEDELSQGRLLNSGGPEWQIPLEIRLYRQPADMAAVAESVWALSVGATKLEAS